MDNRDLKAKVEAMIADNPKKAVIVALCIGAGVVLAIGLIV